MTIENERILAALKEAVSETLEKKRRLEQYAVVWENNHPVIIENNDKKATMVLNHRPTEQPEE